MTGWREELAKDLYKRNPDINVRMLNEVVQRILDRFVFIRIAEDRKVIEPKSLLELVELWKSEGKRRPLLYHLNILFRQINGDLNGEIFKPHACETYEFESNLLAKIIEFLLGAYQKLIDYHIKHYIEHPAEAGRSTLFPDLIIDPDGSHRLSITKKAEILQNNIFG